jgi:hypothetical protein
VNAKLSASLRDHLATARYEDTPARQIDVIKGDLRPKFIDQDALNREILLGLQPMFEEWAGVPLKPAIAYGLRVYQNQSSLLMHVDKIEDHVISAILHVGHAYDDDAEPWPLVIESFDGSTHAVNLAPGDLLFYESAKCMHGRPRPFKGKYYSSIFIHYLPVRTRRTIGGWATASGLFARVFSAALSTRRHPLPFWPPPLQLCVQSPQFNHFSWRTFYGGPRPTGL